MPSPTALRYDPRLRKRSWRVEGRSSWDGFLADARERFGDDEKLVRTLWHGGLLLNGRPVVVDAPPGEVAAGSWVAAWSFEREPEPVVLGRERLLLDEGGLVAVDKPAWLPVQGTRASQRLGVEAQLRALLGEPRLIAVHRLDRQTSGVVLFARTRAVAREIGAAFAARRVEKTYLAWVAPPPLRETFAVTGLLARAPHPSRFKFAIAATGKPSETGFRVRAREGERALVEARPLTGRSHQIRVHLAAEGCPVVGDELYGPPYAPPLPASAERVLLHAASLRLPFRDGWLELVAPLPEDMRQEPAPGPVRA